MTIEEGQPEKRSIALIGLRGCGKSVVARELAKLLGGDHVDTDELVVARAGKSIAAIFADDGEAAFRRLEKAVIIEVAHQPTTVISVGGGAVMDQANIDNLRATATLVWLTAPAEVLWQRIEADPATASTRPPLTNEAGLVEMQQLLAQRSPLYEQASDLTIDTTQRTPPAVAEAIVAALRTDPRPR
jgi:shikimate kinase